MTKKKQKYHMLEITIQIQVRALKPKFQNQEEGIWLINLDVHFL